MGKYVQVEPDVKLYVEDIGSGKPVLFIHGWPLNHTMFEYQMSQLPEVGYRYIGVDQRGFGKSDAPWDGYDYNRQADDIRAVIDALGLDHVNLVGFSIGGAIAVRYMARHSGYKVDKLVLAGAAAPSFTQREGYTLGMPESEVNKLIKQAKTDRPKMVADFGGMFLHKTHSKPFMDWMQAQGTMASAHGTIKCLESLRDEDLRGDLPLLNVPTAILHGETDEICPFDFALAMDAAIPDSRLVRFTDSGHGLLFDEQEKFNYELIDFLDNTVLQMVPAQQGGMVR
ncbi:alpha/beta fold hydrolase [Paenibacillus nasutitermitis]|uniref:AB hydrolase superfamily protein YisY n=1 Tax=Paenibacillus nasutitermitis TaxID=1652958 RepID=A0A916YN53_9BACL|nr:alpha/beta hydrolase [Paenibacillus nasutitermitis]GGD52674.1 AB hydrolase superfamily protein YisY [Paenibacillus nasutitermitis]